MVVLEILLEFSETLKEIPMNVIALLVYELNVTGVPVKFRGITLKHHLFFFLWCNHFQSCKMSLEMALRVTIKHTIVITFNSKSGIVTTQKRYNFH